MSNGIENKQKVLSALILSGKLSSEEIDKVIDYFNEVVEKENSGGPELTQILLDIIKTHDVNLKLVDYVFDNIGKLYTPIDGGIKIKQRVLSALILSKKLSKPDLNGLITFFSGFIDEEFGGTELTQILLDTIKAYGIDVETKKYIFDNLEKLYIYPDDGSKNRQKVLSTLILSEKLTKDEIKKILDYAGNNENMGATELTQILLDLIKVLGVNSETKKYVFDNINKLNSEINGGLYNKYKLLYPLVVKGKLKENEIEDIIDYFSVLVDENIGSPELTSLLLCVIKKYGANSQNYKLVFDNLEKLYNHKDGGSSHKRDVLSALMLNTKLTKNEIKQIIDYVKNNLNQKDIQKFSDLISG